MSEINTITIIGAGTMGNGIAHVAAQSGLRVFLVDVKEEFLDRAKKTIVKNMQRQVDKRKTPIYIMDDAMENLNYTTDQDMAVGEADLIVEAVYEDPALKFEIFKRLEKTAKAGAILASNTSSISINDMAAVTSRPDKVIGMHFMNPVPMMKLVEVVVGKETSKETIDAIEQLSRKMGKITGISQDSPGFIANRILMPMINEAIYTLQEGVGTKEAIDTVIKLGLAHPMGPLTLADLIGLDVCLAIMEVLYKGFEDEKYKPCSMLQEMVAAGNLGRKTGKGFYDYS